MFYNDVSWQLLPRELGFGSGQTCWCRPGRWHEVGVFDQLHRLLLAELYAADEQDWSRACVDASHIRAKKGGEATGPSPVDCGKTGSKHPSSPCPAASSTGDASRKPDHDHVTSSMCRKGIEADGETVR